MPTNTASPSENRLRLLGIKTIYGDGDPTTAIGSDMGIPTLYINNGTKAAFLLTETDPVTWVDVGAVSFGKNVLSILDASAAPPVAPTLGDAYLLDSTTTINAGWVAAGATYDNRVEWSGSSWLVSVQTQGDIVYVDDVSTFYIYDGSDWILLINSIGGLSYTTDSRPPNTSDNTQPVPSLWLDTAANTSYILTDVTATIATWLKMADNQLGDAQNSVLSIADSTATPPTEVLGDRYILSTDGAPNAAWDGAAQEDIVQFDGATWVALTPTEGTFCEVEDVDTVYMFVTSWVKMFTYTGATFASDSGNATPDGASIITFAGDTAQGLDSSATGSTVTYTIADASNTQKGVLETATSAEAIAGSSGTVALTPLSFGAKLGTQTQFGIPSGNATTGTLQWTTGLTDGQLAIGRSGTFPQAGTITSDFLTVTPGAGTLAVDLPQDAITTSVNSWNGSVVETPDIGVTSDGATITLSIEQSGGGDLTVVFSDGFYAWDTSPADTVTLTAGSDTSPQINYVYLLQSTKTLTASTSGWPVTEHAPVATVLCQSAASLQTDLAYKVHAWTDHIVGTDDMGHISDINYWIRQQNATWTDGVAQTYTITTNGGSADNVILTTSSGNVLQLHTQTFPAFSGTPDYYVVNDSSTPYNKVTDLNTLLTDSAGGSMSGKYFTLIIWGCVSEDTGDCKLFVNLPGGSYNGTSTLADDSNGYANYSIPDAFRGTGFLISEWQLRHQTASSGTWTSIDEIDLRGLVPNISPTTGGSGGSSTTEFVDNAFRILDEGDNTKEIAFQASGITTATTRTITAADQDIDMTPTTGSYQGTDATLTALAAYNTNGLLTQTAADTFAGRTITGTANQVSVSNGDGVSGNPTLSTPQDIATTSTVEFGKLGLGTSTVPHGSVGFGLAALDGVNANSAGPHMQFTTASDDYPLMQILPWTHDNVNIYFDGYRDAGGQKSSSSNGNFRIKKGSSVLTIAGETGIAAGSAATFVDLWEITTEGEVTKPLQPWVIATGTSSSNQTGDGTQYNQVFNTEIKDVGGNFASSTFTAPITGCYQQSYNVIYEGLSSSNTYCRGRIVTSNRTYEDYLILKTAQASFNTNRVVHAMDMDSGDTAVCNVVVFGSTKVVDINGAKYSCYLLG